MQKKRGDERDLLDFLGVFYSGADREYLERVLVKD